MTPPHVGLERKHPHRNERMQGGATPPHEDPVAAYTEYTANYSPPVPHGFRINV